MDQRPLKLDDAPLAAVEVCRRLQENGFSAYFVGGAVRDALLGRDRAADWDVATSARPEQVGRLFRRVFPIGIEHGTVLVRHRELPIEVTTFRGEGRYSDGRRPDNVEFLDDIRADLMRRDFTINAIAFDPIAKALVDPFGGREDLEKKLVRAVGDPVQRFREDGLRLLRAVRLAAVLEFSLEDQTLAALRSERDALQRISGERVRDELFKLLGARRPAAGIRTLEQTGLITFALPEIAKTSPEELERALSAVDQLPPMDSMLRLATLVFVCWVERTQGDVADDCLALSKRLRLSNEQKRRVGSLVRGAMFEAFQPTPAKVRRFAAAVGSFSEAKDILAIREAEMKSRGASAEETAWSAEFATALGEEMTHEVPLRIGDLNVSGEEIMIATGLGAGPHIGELLRALLERVLDDPSVNTHETLLELVATLARDHIA